MDKMFHRIDFTLNGNAFMQPGFIVTSPQIPGLLATGATIPNALEDAAKAIRELALACAMETAAGREVKSMFSDAEYVLVPRHINVDFGAILDKRMGPDSTWCEVLAKIEQSASVAKRQTRRA